VPPTATTSHAAGSREGDQQEEAQEQDEGGLGGTTGNRSGRQVAWDVITVNDLPLPEI
jgi:hypothetical protein